jgi:PAS domain S-box-containing protein
MTGEKGSLHQQLQSARERLQDLRKRAAASPNQQALLEETLAELSISIEELSVSVEELRQQNAELIATREMVEAEPQHYQELFEFAPDGYLVTDLDGIIQEANMAAVRLLGVDQKFLIHKPLISYVAQEDHRHLSELLGRLRNQENIQIFEMMLQPRQGPNVAVSVTVCAVRSNPSASARGADAVAARWLLQDITERREAQAQLRDQAQLLNLAHDAVLVTDLDNRILYWNFGAQRTYGWSADEAKGKLKHELLQTEFPQGAGVALEAIVRDGHWEGELVQSMCDGKRIFVDSRWALQKDSHGQPRAVLKINRDITARKKAEDLVQTSLRRVIALREINEAIMSTLDLQQILDFLLEKIEEFFPYPIATTVRLFNRDKKLEYLACRNIKDEDWKNYHPGSPGARGQEVIRTKAPLVVRNIQTDPRIIRRPDFYRRNNLVSYLAVPLMTKGEVLGLLCVYTKAEHEFSDQEIAFLSGVGSQAALAIYNSRLYEQLKEQSLELRKAHDELEQRVEERTADLTKVNDDLRFEIAERQRVEDELRRSEERSRNLAKQLEGQLIISDRLVTLGELAASFAHEFNNPLAIILGLSQEMRLGLERSDPHYESITAIEQEALRCRKVVLDLFDFVRPKEATFTPVDVGEILHKTISLLSVQHKKSNIKTVVDLEPDLPPIFADLQQLRQVLINLSFNAAEAMVDGGTLAFRAGANRVATKDHSGNDAAQFELTIAICDTGPGIGPEVLPDIFRPFFSTKKGKGMGLGLSICERIMKTHRGRISVESRPGEGTTFYLHFPVPEVKE